MFFIGTLTLYFSIHSFIQQGNNKEKITCICLFLYVYNLKLKQLSED